MKFLVLEEFHSKPFCVFCSVLKTWKSMNCCHNQPWNIICSLFRTTFWYYSGYLNSWHLPSTSCSYQLKMRRMLAPFALKVNHNFFFLCSENHFFLLYVTILQVSHELNSIICIYFETAFGVDSNFTCALTVSWLYLFSSNPFYS